jgi:hypothetical protein
MFQLCSMHRVLHDIDGHKSSVPGGITNLSGDLEDDVPLSRMCRAVTFNDMGGFHSKHRHPYNLVWVHDRACREGLSQVGHGAFDAASDARVSSIPLTAISVRLLVV